MKNYLIVFAILSSFTVFAGKMNRSTTCSNPSSDYSVSLQRSVGKTLIWVTIIHNGKKVGHIACKDNRRSRKIEYFECDINVDTRYRRHPDYRDTYMGSKENFSATFTLDYRARKTIDFTLLKDNLRLANLHSCI